MSGITSRWIVNGSAMPRADSARTSRGETPSVEKFAGDIVLLWRRVPLEIGGVQRLSPIARERTWKTPKLADDVRPCRSTYHAGANVTCVSGRDLPANMCQRSPFSVHASA